MDKVIVKEVIPKSSDVLWNLITELNHMKQWFFENLPEFEAKIGFKVEFNVVSGERSFLHAWEIIEVDVKKLIKYNWRYPEYFDGDSFVTFCLNKLDKDKTEVVIISEGINNYPKNIPEFTYESCRGGWEYFINRLKEYSDEIN